MKKLFVALSLLASFNANAFWGDPLDDARESNSLRQDLCHTHSDEVKSTMSETINDIMNDIGFFEYKFTKIENNLVRRVNNKDKIEAVQCLAHFDINDKHSGERISGGYMGYYVNEDGDFVRRPELLLMHRPFIIKDLKTSLCENIDAITIAYKTTMSELQRVYDKYKDDESIRKQVEHEARYLVLGHTTDETYDEERQVVIGDIEYRNGQCESHSGSQMTYTVTPTVDGSYNVETKFNRLATKFPHWYVEDNSEPEVAYEDPCDLSAQYVINSLTSDIKEKLGKKGRFIWDGKTYGEALSQTLTMCGVDVTWKASGNTTQKTSISWTAINEDDQLYVDGISSQAFNF